MRPSRTALSVAAAAGAAALGGALVAIPASANGDGSHHDYRTIHGTVVSDDGTTLVLTNRSGTHNILVNSNTKYSEAGDPNPVTTASPGQFVAVRIVNQMAAPDSSSSSSSTSSTLSPDSSSSNSPAIDPVAGRVMILLQSISGVVSNINGSTVTLTEEEGQTKTVNVSGADIYQRTKATDGTSTTTPATLALNDLVTAFGSRDKTTPTTFDALFVKDRGQAVADQDNDDSTTTSSTTSSTSSTTSTTEDSSNTLKPQVTSSTAGSHDDSATDENKSGDSAPSATWVKGTVASASNGVIVINQADGSQVTVTTTDSTKYRTDQESDGSSNSSPTPAGFSGIAPKDRIAAEVTPSNGALDAVMVYYAAPESQPDGDQSGSWSQQNTSGSSGGSYGDHSGSDGGSGGSYGGDGSYGGGPGSRH